MQPILEKYGVKLPKSTISTIRSPKEGQEERRLNKLVPTCFYLAYIIGVCLGDGYVTVETRRYKYLIIIAVKDYDFAKFFGKCSAITLGKNGPYKPRWDENLQRWVIKASSRRLYELL